MLNKQTTLKRLFFCYIDFKYPFFCCKEIFLRNVIVVPYTVRNRGNGKTQMILICTVPPLSLDKLTRDPGCPGLSPPRDFFERKRHETSHHLHSRALQGTPTCGHHHSNSPCCEAELVNGREGQKTASRRPTAGATRRNSPLVEQGAPQKTYRASRQPPSLPHK